MEVLGKYFLSVEKPARYTGGEYGRLAKREADLYMAIAFPDLYEIGMSNQAFRILYNKLNAVGGISCDRAFAPAPDFEELLEKLKVPLYGLDTGIPLKHTDILGFTLGYELGITGVLTMLKSAGIPLHASDRTEDDPIVIMGGPCVSNPLPYSSFIDVFWIGEAEGGFFPLCTELRDMKKNGAPRRELLSRIAAHPSVWTRGKARAVRAIDREFSDRNPDAAVFPVPSMKVVQHHGSVEIMRGCPNGCRFCHAGIWYRPMRQKSAAVVKAEAEAFITQGGYREISLSSLSTGDYAGIGGLVSDLNRSYASRHISFQLPSLKVSSFSLPLLKSISEVRKSGLTFAVETPVDAWQFSINKDVCRENVIAIINEAKGQGFRGAKFYFMIGLPVGGFSASDDSSREEQEIVDFILEVSQRTGMHFSVNVGTFIPKPHTPYQWAVQLDEETATQKLNFIRSKLKPRGFKVGTHDPFVSVVEGIISRGDERVGELIIENAFARGCRLDAWTEYFSRDVWRSLIDDNNALVSEILSMKNSGEPLPWDCIDASVGTAFLRRELEKSETQELTSACTDNCTHPCGSCSSSGGIIQNIIQPDNQHQVMPEVPANSDSGNPETDGPEDTLCHRIVFSFSKRDEAVFLPHLGLVETFSMAFIRSGLPVTFTQGFNPLPRLDFAAPLAIGIQGDNEIASVDFTRSISPDIFAETLNKYLPKGIEISRAEYFAIPLGKKRYSAASLLWGFLYDDNSIIKASEEKQYRLNLAGSNDMFFGIRRRSVLAKSITNNNNGGEENHEDYFAAYGKLYPGTN
ncbi:TIGR03960 family B12-binding radical SAM protein [Breznakiella homolactica]|uniref:TIGR03960 family B12-binding radical SAM protein n=2 Tax=Breznakiella homolactica TaxID=2798577 RepID=A0A7T7XS25_9SPIR|nr:TIGR03960 family B12-binding radical SAM protein [Breznakiella homolactica]